MRRKKGAGSIQVKNGNYYYRIKIDGKEKTIRLKASNEKDAEREAAAFASPMAVTSVADVALFVGQQRNIIQQGVPLSSVFASFRNSTLRPQCSERQLQAHNTYWHDFLAFLPPSVICIGDVTHELCNSYFSQLAKTPRSWNVRLKTCRLVFKTVLPRGMENPCDGIKLKHEESESKSEFTEEQVKAIFRAVDHDYPLSIPCREDMKMLFRVAAYTGMRLKDCCLLKWTAIKKGLISVIPFKTASHRNTATIPIHPDLLAMLSEGRGGERGYVMPELADRYNHNPSGVDKTACRVIAWALEKEHSYYKMNGKKYPKVPEVQSGYGFHSFRHSFVSFCANAGVPVDIVKDIVGHSNTAITRIYTHISAETRAQVINALPSMNAEKPVDKKVKLKELLHAKKKLTEAEKLMLEMLE